jgi:hypothetical protein
VDLLGLTSGAVGVVNPFETVAVSESTGYALNPDGSQSPAYTTDTIQAQIQALTGKDLRQIESMNLQGTLRRMYFEGEVDAIIRMLNKGGDLVTRSDGTIWKVTTQLEQWPDWCAVVVTLQDGS